MNTRETTSGPTKSPGIVIAAAVASGLSFFALDLIMVRNHRPTDLREIYGEIYLRSRRSGLRHSCST